VCRARAAAVDVALESGMIKAFLPDGFETEFQKKKMMNQKIDWHISAGGG